MLQTIYSPSPNLLVENGYSQFNNLYFYSVDGPSGNLRINPVTRVLEVFTGQNWTQINGNMASLRLSTDADMALDWAKTKMQEEKKASELAETNSSVKSALDNLHKAQEQLTIIMTLIEKDEELKNV
jgi:hypothetical protein